LRRKIVCRNCNFSPTRFALAESARAALARIADASGGAPLGKLVATLLAAGEEWTRSDVEQALDHLAREGWIVLSLNDTGAVRVQLHTPVWARPRREGEARVR
jgi:hypothetical protein